LLLLLLLLLLLPLPLLLLLLLPFPLPLSRASRQSPWSAARAFCGSAGPKLSLRNDARFRTARTPDRLAKDAP